MMVTDHELKMIYDHLKAAFCNAPPRLKLDGNERHQNIFVSGAID